MPKREKRPKNILIRHLTDAEIRSLKLGVRTTYWPRRCWPCANSLYLRILRSFLAMNQKERTAMLRHAPPEPDWMPCAEGGLLVNRKGKGMATRNIINRNAPA
jgi:hypothetical protein